MEVERQGGKVVIKLHGSADMVESDRLRDLLKDLAAEKLSITVLDLHDVDFIGSAALAAIVLGYVKNRHHRGQFRIVAPQPAVREVLETTCLTTLFPVYASVENALTA